MSLLSQIYSQMTGLRLGRAHICKKFFPLPDEKYITIQPNSKNQPAKCYSYWNEVIDFISPLLSQGGIKIYQIGEKDEPPLKGTVALMGQTSICQAHYIISNSILHISADSFSAHSAGYMGIPSVALYGNTSPQHHGPAQRDKAILIESHRNNNNPSFGPDQTINLIPPEQIINAILTQLGAVGKLDRKSLHFGRAYVNTLIEWVPNFPLDANSLKDIPIIARFDLHKEESILFNTLSSRKLNIVIDSDISITPLNQLKNNIIGLTIEFKKTSNLSKEFIKQLKVIGVKPHFITFESDDEWISQKRLEFFDYAQIHKVSFPNKNDLLQSVNNYTNSNDAQNLIASSDLWVRSNKFILSNGKIYLSHFHLNNNISTESFENNVVNFSDSPEIYKDIEHFYIFRQYVGENNR